MLQASTALNTSTSVRNSRGRVGRFLVLEHLAGLKFFFQNTSLGRSQLISELLALKRKEIETK